MKTGLFDLTGEVAMVTGAGGALGSAMVDCLASSGAHVVIGDRNEKRGQERARELRASGAKADSRVVDVLVRADLEAARDWAESNCGPVTILVNAAGGNRPEATLPPGADFCKLPLDAWKTVFDLNLVGAVLLPCQVFGETMIAAGRGSIINIASMSGMIPLSRVVAYSAAKAGVINLTKFLSREWALRGVRVNCLSPGFFPGEQNRALLFNEDGTYSARGKQIISHTPMARFGVPEELQGAVVWLASSRASSFVTGQNIVVDGGFSSSTI